jgi:hypothetical protein
MQRRRVRLASALRAHRRLRLRPMECLPSGFPAPLRLERALRLPLSLVRRPPLAPLGLGTLPLPPLPGSGLSAHRQLWGPLRSCRRPLERALQSASPRLPAVRVAVLGRRPALARRRPPGLGRRPAALALPRKEALGVPRLEVTRRVRLCLVSSSPPLAPALLRWLCRRGRRLARPWPLAPRIRDRFRLAPSSRRKTGHRSTKLPPLPTDLGRLGTADNMPAARRILHRSRRTPSRGVEADWARAGGLEPSVSCNTASSDGSTLSTTRLLRTRSPPGPSAVGSPPDCNPRTSREGRETRG